MSQPNLMDRCKNCRKTRGEHNATTKACPVGKKSRAGYITYSRDKVFEEKK